MERANSEGSIFLVGFMACGKTTTGPLLAEKLGLPFVDLDRLIEEREGQTIAGIIAGEGEAGFRSIETERLRRAIGEGRVVMAPGGGAILQAVNRQLMAAHGVTVWLDAPFELCWERIGRDEVVRPLAANESAARARYEQRLPLYGTADLRIPIDAGMSPDDIAGLILAELTR